MSTPRNALIPAVLAALMVSCGSSAPPAPAPATAPPEAAGSPAGGPQPVASVLELMDQVIDPAADTLWASVAYTNTARGVVEHRPRTDADWLELRRAALVLLEATNLLAQPGRVVAQPGHTLADATAPGMLSADQIQSALVQQHGVLATLARGLQVAGQKALAAVDSRDLKGLEESGGEIDEACEACHKVFWYPPAASAVRP